MSFLEYTSYICNSGHVNNISMLNVLKKVRIWPLATWTHTQFYIWFCNLVVHNWREISSAYNLNFQLKLPYALITNLCWQQFCHITIRKTNCNQLHRHNYLDDYVFTTVFVGLHCPHFTNEKAEPQSKSTNQAWRAQTVQVAYTTDRSPSHGRNDTLQQVSSDSIVPVNFFNHKPQHRPCHWQCAMVAQQ